MNRNGVRLPAVAVLLWLTSMARADVLFDTLADPQIGTPSASAYVVHNFPPFDGTGGDDLWTAVPFTVAPNLAFGLDAVVLNVAARFNANQRLTVSLFNSDASGLPGTAVDSWTTTNLPVRSTGGGPGTHPLTTIPTPSHPTVTAGKHWLVLSTPDANFGSDIYWYERADLQGPAAQRSFPLNGPGWRASTLAPQPQVRVLATPVPEPGAAALLAGTATLTLRRHRRP